MATKSFEERLGSFSSSTSLSISNPADINISSVSLTDLPPQLRNPPSNIPLKFAEAGWYFPASSSISDELVCDSCGVKHSGWEGDSPLAVHRIKSPNCPFLNTEQKPNDDNNLFTQCSSSSMDIDLHNKQNLICNVDKTETVFSICDSCDTSSREHLKRKLFTSKTVQNETDHSLTKYSRHHQPIVHPFKPLVGGFQMLFESLRLSTFTSPSSTEAAKWSKEGFIMISNLEAKCVFCGLVLEYKVSVEIEHFHKNRSPQCPFVCHFDVGNVSCELHRKILESERSKHLSNISIGSSNAYNIKHPEFEDLSNRCDTFGSWPKMLKKVLPPKTMSEAEFYYTGVIYTILN